MKNFISFEGVECSGKTTLINIIKEKLTQEGYKVIITREPGGSNIAENIRNFIIDEKNKDISFEAESLLFAASRIEHINKLIMPKLKENYIVISDRYLDSSYAYQGFARNLGIKKIKKANFYASKYLPDRTYFIDITPKNALERINNRENKKEYFDNYDISFHNKVYEGYLYLAKHNKKRIKTVDGTLKINDLANIIYEDLKKYING